MNEQEFLKKVTAGTKGKVLCLMRFGSHLYGTNTESSDTDYKGVFLPTEKDVLLQRVPKSVSFNSKTSRGEGEKNSSGDVDCELYSLHYFVDLACKGETAALDMLHVNEQNLLLDSTSWQTLVDYRRLFYTCNLKSFVGYARKQAAKYGLKGSRLSAATKLLHYLEGYKTRDCRMIDVWAGLPLGEHSGYLRHLDNDKFKVYQFCGKQVQSTAKVSYVYDMVQQFLEQYGERAKQAQQNEGVDWKAMSHALRAAYQVEEILSTENLKYPLKCAEYLKAVKEGLIPFKNVLRCLEDLMERVEALSEMSHFPAKADRRFWDQVVIDILGDHYDPE